MAALRPYLECPEDGRLEVRETLAQVLGQEPAVQVAFLFGSFVDQPRFRDIDVGVLVDPQQVPEAAAWDFAWDRATRLELATRLPVDLSVLNYAPVALRYHASLGQVLVCKEPEACDAFCERAWDEYLDFEPFLWASLRDLLEGGGPPENPLTRVKRP